MFLGKVMNVSSGAVFTPIPFVTSFNTNKKTSNNAGVISLKEPGLYNVDAIIDAQLPTGATSQSVTAELYADGQSTTTMSSATPADDGQPFTLTIADAVRVLPDEFPNLAEIDIRLNTANIVINSATLRVEYVQ